MLSAEQMRAFDRHASDALGVPSLELMENAGVGATEAPPPTADLGAPNDQSEPRAHASPVQLFAHASAAGPGSGFAM